MEKQSAEINLVKEGRKYAAGLLLAIAAVNGFVALVMGSEVNFVFYDMLRIGSIATAAGLSFAVFSRQGVKGLFGRAYTGLVVGLTMWLVAESIWGYYEIVLGEESPFPSLADAFWLGAYGGLLFYVFSLYKFFGRGVKKYTIAGVTAAVAIFGFFYLQSLISISLPPDGEALTEEYVLPLAISVAYPVLDAILLIPAILIVSNSGKGQLTSIPWAFVSFILVAIADILLGYSAVTGFNDVTIITMFYNASYLFMSAGLLWYLRFFISGQKQALKD
jgi:hypothetical protein